MSFNPPAGTQFTEEQQEASKAYFTRTSGKHEAGLTVQEEHKTVHVDFLDADIDEQVLPLVMEMNSAYVTTISSCQGDPGIIGQGGRYGHIAFQMAEPNDWTMLSNILFKTMWPVFKPMWDDVRVEMTASENGFYGWLYFRNEAIPSVLKAMREF